MFNTAHIMEWHNTALLCCFRDFLHIDEKCKSFNCENLKTGAGYRGYGQYERFEQTFCLAATALLWAVKSMDC